MVSESLPNIKGQGYDCVNVNNASAINSGLCKSGAIYVTTVSTGSYDRCIYALGRVDNQANMLLDASRATSVYQDSANVRPNSCCTGWCIKY